MKVRKYLLLLDPRKDHINYWRPQMLLLVRNPRTACSLIHFVNRSVSRNSLILTCSFARRMKKSGLYIIGHVKRGDFSDPAVPDQTATQVRSWLQLVDHLDIKAFVELTMAETARAGAQQLIRLSGIGGMKPNTVILGNEPQH